MKIVELRPGLHLIQLAFGQAYLWRDDDALTLIDTGIAGSGAAIAGAIRDLGQHPRDLRQIVLTHFHDDHAGAAAEMAASGPVSVMAHRLDAPMIRGDVSGPPPDFADGERALHRRLGAHLLPSAPPCRVDRELDDEDLIDVGGGAVVVATPGHTEGAIAVYLPHAGVLFTGDTVAHVEGRVLPGVFNLDRAQVMDSFRRLAAFDADLACVGHGDPIVGDVPAVLRAALERFAA